MGLFVFFSKSFWSLGDYFWGLKMIKCYLSKLMGEKKLKISDVSNDTGINRGTITRLYHETAVRVEFEVLERLCLYFDCEIGDLLEISKDRE